MNHRELLEMFCEAFDQSFQARLALADGDVQVALDRTSITLLTDRVRVAMWLEEHPA